MIQYNLNMCEKCNVKQRDVDLVTAPFALKAMAPNPNMPFGLERRKLRNARREQERLDFFEMSIANRKTVADLVELHIGNNQ